LEKLYEHWTQIPRTDNAWPYRYFTPKELACKGSGSLLVVHSFIEALDMLRSFYNSPISINSSYRSPRHNALVGGAPLSRHKMGDAADIGIVGKDKEEIRRIAEKMGGWNGVGLYNSFIHLDRRERKATWGSW